MFRKKVRWTPGAGFEPAHPFGNRLTFYRFFGQAFFEKDCTQGLRNTRLCDPGNKETTANDL